MDPRPGTFQNGIRFLFTKRLTVSLFVILPVVFALTAFASGFIALIDGAFGVQSFVPTGG